MYNIYRFIRLFIFYWRDYPAQIEFMNAHPKLLKIAQDNGDYEKFYKTRPRFAWKLARIWWGHRDRGSRKCTGDCENCTAEHC